MEAAETHAVLPQTSDLWQNELALLTAALNVRRTSYYPSRGVRRLVTRYE